MPPTDRRQQEFVFVSAIDDVLLRDERESASMPFLSLGKTKRVQPIEWRNADGSRWCQVVAPAETGLATIFDFDVVLWLVSQLNDVLEKGATPAKTIRCSMYDLLKGIKRGTSGRAYLELEAALSRLKATTIRTNVRAAGKRERSEFGLIEQWSHVVDERSGRSLGLSLTLPDWIFNAVVKERAVLQLAPAYFDLTSGLARWLYRLVRRHAGRQDGGWRFTFRDLHARSGSLQSFAAFSRDIRRLISQNSLPEYDLQLIRGQRGDDVLHAQRRLELSKDKRLRPLKQLLER